MKNSNLSPIVQDQTTNLIKLSLRCSKPELNLNFSFDWELLLNNQTNVIYIHSRDAVETIVVCTKIKRYRLTCQV